LPSSPPPGPLPAPRSDAPAPAAPPPDIASTAASPADSSPPSAPPLPPTSSRLRLPAQEPPHASTLVRSSLSSSTRPPLEACSLGDISTEHERGHYHRGTTGPHSRADGITSKRLRHRRMNTLAT